MEDYWIMMHNLYSISIDCCKIDLDQTVFICKSYRYSLLMKMRIHRGLHRFVQQIDDYSRSTALLESGRTDCVVLHRAVSKETGVGLLMLARGAQL